MKENIKRKKVSHINDYKEEIKVKDNSRKEYFSRSNAVVDFSEYLFTNVYERVVLETLARYGNNNDDMAKVGITTLAKKCRCSKNTFLKTIRLLEEKEYITVVETEGVFSTNIYHLHDIRDFVTEEMIINQIEEKTKSYRWEEEKKEEELSKLLIRYGYKVKKKGSSQDELGKNEGGSPDELGGSPDELGSSRGEHNKELPLKEHSLKKLRYSFLINLDLKPSTINNINKIDGLTEDFFNQNYQYILNNESVTEGLLVKALREGKRLGSEDLARKKEKESQERKNEILKERQDEENKEIMELAIKLYRCDINIPEEKPLDKSQKEAFERFCKNKYIDLAKKELYSA